MAWFEVMPWLLVAVRERSLASRHRKDLATLVMKVVRYKFMVSYGSCYYVVHNCCFIQIKWPRGGHGVNLFDVGVGQGCNDVRSVDVKS